MEYQLLDKTLKPAQLMVLMYADCSSYLANEARLPKARLQRRYTIRSRRGVQMMDHFNKCSTSIRTSRTRFHGLDAIRGLAAIFVATLHIPFLTAKLWLPESILAVDLFFCLSGVVLAEAYKLELGDGMRWRTFMMLRLVRLYPFYLLSIGLSLIVAVVRLRGGEAAFLLLLAAFLLPCGGPASFPLNGPAWSLCDELLASAAYGIVVKLRLPSMPFVLAPMFAFGLLGYCFLSGAKGLNFGADVYTFPGGLVRVGFSFFTGTALCSVYHAAQTRWSTLSLGNVSTCILLILIAAIFTVKPREDFRLLYELAAVFLIFPCLVFAALWCRPDGTALRLATSFGALSYPLYILHEPIAKIIEIVMSGNAAVMIASLQYLPLWFGLIFLILVMIFSFLVNSILEHPIRATSSALRNAEPRRPRIIPARASAP